MNLHVTRAMPQGDHIIIYSYQEIRFGIYGLDPHAEKSAHTGCSLHSNNSNLPSQPHRVLGKKFANRHVLETTQLTQSIHLESSSNKSS